MMDLDELECHAKAVIAEAEIGGGDCRYCEEVAATQMGDHDPKCKIYFVPKLCALIEQVRAAATSRARISELEGELKRIRTITDKALRP